MTHLAGGEVRKIEFNGVAEPPTVYGHVVSEKVLIIRRSEKLFANANTSHENITENEIESIVRDLDRLPASDLYESNKTIMKMV